MSPIHWNSCISKNMKKYALFCSFWYSFFWVVQDNLHCFHTILLDYLLLKLVYKMLGYDRYCSSIVHIIFVRLSVTFIFIVFGFIKLTTNCSDSSTFSTTSIGGSSTGSSISLSLAASLSHTNKTPNSQFLLWRPTVYFSFY